MTISISETSVNFLDLTISVDSGRLSTSIDNKEIDSRSYLLYSSSHPSKCKDSIRYAQFKRLRRICSNDNDFNAKADEMWSFFKNRLYPDRTINQAKQRVSTMDRNEALQPSSNSSDNDNRIPPVITYHPSNILIRNIIVKNFEFLRKHESSKHIFTDLPITTYRRERNIRNRIVRARDPQSPWHYRMQTSRCKTCAHVLHTVEITGSDGIHHHITSSFTSTSRNLIYAIICQRCQMLYIGETKTALSTRCSNHLRAIRSNLPGRPVATHFNSTGHAIQHAKITGILLPVILIKIAILLSNVSSPNFRRFIPMALTSVLTCWKTIGSPFNSVWPNNIFLHFWHHRLYIYILFLSGLAIFCK